MESCTHEEADTRIVIHVRHAVEHGAKTVVVRTVDTDVVVILLGLLSSLFSASGLFKLWVAFGSGKKFRFINVNTVFHHLGPKKAVGILMFHSKTGCDTVSAFNGIGKLSAWKVWGDSPDVTEIFQMVSNKPFTNVIPYSTAFSHLEQFVINMYDKSNSAKSVNEARRLMFTKKNCMFDRLPPTQVLCRKVYTY
jgi:hypothetical protein